MKVTDLKTYKQLRTADINCTETNILNILNDLDMICRPIIQKLGINTNQLNKLTHYHNSHLYLMETQITEILELLKTTNTNFTIYYMDEHSEELPQPEIPEKEHT